MRIIQVVPKEIEVVFGLSVEVVKEIVLAINTAEFDLDETNLVDRKTFNTVIEFYELLKGLLKEME